MSSTYQALRAAALLVVYGVTFVLATPGLDVGMQPSESDQAVEALEERGPDRGLLSVGPVARLDREVRQPIVRLLKPLERPLRIAQSWALYGDGAGDVRRLEVWVGKKGERLVYRTGDPDYTWRADLIGSRRLRPLIEGAGHKPASPNIAGLVRLLGRRAADDFGVDTIVLTYRVAPWPVAPVPEGGVHPASLAGGGLSVAHRLVAKAPDWSTSVQLP